MTRSTVHRQERVSYLLLGITADYEEAGTRRMATAYVIGLTGPTYAGSRI